MFTGVPYCKKLCLNFIYIILNVLFLHVYIPEWYSCCVKQFSNVQLNCFVFLSAVFVAKFYTHLLNIGLHVSIAYREKQMSNDNIKTLTLSCLECSGRYKKEKN